MKFVLYNHIGSGNHGCEALVRTISSFFNDSEVVLLSERPYEEEKYGISEKTQVECAIFRNPFSLDYIKAYTQLKLKKDYFPMDAYPYLAPIRKIGDDVVGVSIGGDVYCYENYPKYILIHQQFVKQGIKTVLLGCSLEQELFKDKSFLDDLHSYDYISARESLTFNFLKSAGLTNIGLAPDSAFTLPSENLPLPVGFIEGNTVGINLSPLVIRKEASPGIVLENYKKLVQWILDNTDCSVALIPHVVWEDNDDRTVIQDLKNSFIDDNRVVTISDCNCMQLKGYIARCRFFVGARTHSTIAAYSTGVPTLVVGYSVKSKGIATDLFGTSKGYVLSVDDIKEKDSLCTAFVSLFQNEKNVKHILSEVLPEYISKAESTKNIFRALYSEKVDYYGFG